MFRVAQSPDEIIRAYCIRAIVFIGEQGCPYAEEIDGLDDDAIHVLGEIDGEPFATGRIRLIGDYAKLERLAVLKPHRGKGFGGRLLNFMLNIAGDRGAGSYRLHAQVGAIAFYEKFGFHVAGAVFDEAGIPHRLMVISGPGKE